MKFRAIQGPGGEAARDGITVGSASLTELGGITDELCSLPDPLDTASRYLREEAAFLRDVLEGETTAAVFEQTDDTGALLANFERLIDAWGTPDFDRAAETSSDAFRESERRRAQAEAAAQAARRAARKSLWRVRFTVWLWVPAVRVVALALAASGGWWVGFQSNDLRLLVQILIAIATFAFLDLVVVDHFVEPVLKEHRRRVLRKSASLVEATVRDALVALGRGGPLEGRASD